jgi:plastocyanin
VCVVVAAAVAALVALGLTGCASSSATTLTFTGNELRPYANMTVAPGTTVTWVNGDQTAHTVTSTGIDASTTLYGKPTKPGEFNSGPLNPGQTFSHTFNQAGTYEYIDNVQVYIVGTVTVQ